MNHLEELLLSLAAGRRRVSIEFEDDEEFVPPDEWSDDAYRDGGFGGIPASAAAIAGLEKQMYIGSMAGPTMSKKRRGMDGETVTGEPPACAICLDGFEMGDVLSVMPCSHCFHGACLAKWLALSRLCPCCRHALPGEDEMQPAAVSHDHDAAAAPSSTTATTAEGGGGGGGAAAAASNQSGFEGSSRARPTRRIMRYQPRHAIVRHHTA